MILYVEDNIDDAFFLQQVVERAGVKNPSLSFTDGLQLVAFLGETMAFEKGSKAVLFLDLRLPNMDGFDVLEWLRRRPRSIDFLIVVVAGVNDMSVIQRAYDLGANSFVKKPFSEDDIQELITTYPGYWQVD